MNIAVYTKSHARIWSKLHCRYLKAVSRHITDLSLYFRNNNNKNIFYSYKIIATPLAQLTAVRKY